MKNGLYLNSKLNIICKSFCQFFINRVTRIQPAHFWRHSGNRFHPLIYTEVVCLGGSPNTSKTAGIEMGFLIPWVLCTEVFRHGLPCMVNIFFVTNPKSYKVCIRVWLPASTGEPVDVTTKPWSCHWCTSMMITHVNRLWASLTGLLTSVQSLPNSSPSVFTHVVKKYCKWKILIQPHIVFVLINHNFPI